MHINSIYKNKIYLKKNKILDICIKTFMIIVWLILISINLVNDSGYSALLIYSIVLNILLINKFKYIQVVYLILVYTITYLLYPILYFIFKIDIAYYGKFQHLIYFSKVLQIHSLFMLSLYCFTQSKVTINKKSFRKKISSQINKIDNPIIFYFLVFMIIIFTLIGKSGQNIFISGSYGVNNVSSPLFEYVLILFVIAYKYSSQNKFRKNLLIGVYILYCIRSLLFGGRIEVIQSSIIIFILYFDKKLKLKYITLIVIIGYLIMTFIGNIRLNTMSDNILSIERFNPIEYSINENGNKYSISNQGDVFYNSSVYIGLIENKTYDFNFRLKSLIGNIQRIFMIDNGFSDEANLSNHSKKYAPAGGGGLISTYFFVWGGILGVIFIAYFVATILNNIYISKNEGFYLYAIMALATVPRWFAYEPITLFKLSAYIIIVNIGIRYLDVITRRIYTVKVDNYEI